MASIQILEKDLLRYEFANFIFLLKFNSNFFPCSLTIGDLRGRLHLGFLGDWDDEKTEVRGNQRKI